MAKKTGLSVLSEKIGGKLVSGGASSSSSSNGKSYSRGTTSSSGRRSSGLESLSDKIGATSVAEKRPKELTDWYLDTLNNQTYLPHNTHMDELNAHMMEEGLHPIYTDNAAVKPFYGELTPYAKGKWSYDEKTDSFVPPKTTDVDWYIGKAQEAKTKADAGAAEYSRQREEKDPTDEIYKLTLDLNAGVISEAEYERRVSEIGATDYSSEADEAYREAQKKAADYRRESAVANAQIQSLLKAKDNRAYLQIVQNGDEELFQGVYDAQMNLRTAMSSGSVPAQQEATRELRAFWGKVLAKGYSEEEANELLERFTAVKNAQNREEIEAAVRDFVSKHPVIGGITMTAANLLTAPVRGLTELGGMMLTGGEKDSPYNALSYAANATREQVEQNINDIFIDPETGNGKGWAKAANFVYSAGTSAAESALTMALGGPTGGAVLMGLNAGTETYQEGLERGMSKGQALASGIAAGIAEEFFEKFSLESLSALKAQGRRGVLNFVKDFAKQSLTEGSEEFFTDIANELYDSMVNGEYSKFRQSVDRAMLNGKTWEEATKDYAYNFAKQLGESFIVGALSGGMGAGRVKASNMIGNAVQSVGVGEGVRSAAELQGISEQEVVRPVTELLGEGSKAGRQIDKRLSNEAPQGSQGSEVAAGAAMESKPGGFGDNASASGEKAGVGTKSESKGSLFTRAVTYLQQTASDYRKGAAVTKAVYELRESDRVTIEERLKEAGYGDRNAKSTSYQILQLLSGEMESADAEHLLEKHGVEAVIGDYLTAQGTSDTEEYKRTRAAAELLRSLDIARGEGSAEDKLRRIRWVSETYDLQPEEAIQYFADEATKDVTEEAKKLTRDGKDLSRIVKRAYKAQITVDGKALDVEIKGVAGVEDGDLLLKTEKDGETVKLSEVDFDAFENNDDAKVAFETLRDVMTGDKVTLSSDAANVLLATWETQAYTDSEQFVKDWYRYYAAGKAGRSIRSVERSYDDVELQNRVSETVRESAYQFGAKEYKSEAGVKRVGTAQIGADTAEELYVLNEWAKDVGRSIVVVDALYEKSRRTGIRHAVLEGFSDREGIMLALKSEALFGEGTWREHPITVTAFHETVHQLRLTSEDVYQFLKEIALRALESRVGKEGMAKIYEQRETAYRNELSEDATDEEVRDLIEEEITAQYFGTAVTRGFIEEQVTKEHLSFWEKIRDTLKRIVDSLRKKLEELAKRDLVSAAVMEADVRELQAAVNLFNDAINAVRMLGPARNSALKSAEQTGAQSADVAADAANKNKKSRMMDAGTIRYARMLTGDLADITRSILSADEKTAKENISEANVVQIMTNTPNVILENVKDAEDLPIIMRYDAVYLAVRREGVITGHYHDLGEEVFPRIVEYLNSPDAILRLDNGRINIITRLPVTDKNNGIISIELSTVKDLEDGNKKYNLVVTMMPAKDNYVRNKIKDAVAVEYIREDLGQVNPQLSEWLATVNPKSSDNDDNTDTAKSQGEKSRALDAEYMSAVEAGDMETAQRMVDEAAKAAGYTLPLYHGAKKGGGFAVFKDWQYFTGNKAYAERYTKRDDPSSLYSVYVKAERMFDTRDPKCRKIFEQYRGEYGLGEIMQSGLPDWTDGYDLSDIIEENDLPFDAIVLDEGGDMTADGPVSRGPSYVIRKSAQVKSADPVTYDDDGNVIPLSERFNEKKDDIRFSRALLGPEESNGNYIYPDMEESERAEALKKQSVEIVDVSKSLAENEENLLDIDYSMRSKTEKTIIALAKKMGIIGRHSNPHLEFTFSYSGKNVSEGLHQQSANRQPYKEYAKFIVAAPEAIPAAIPIEAHTDFYKGTIREDLQLENVFVLFGAFSEGDSVVPFEMEIKEYKGEKENILYSSATLGDNISLEKIKKDDVMGQTTDKELPDRPRSSFNISLPRLLREVNPKFIKFLKYVPSELLTEEQLVGKREGVERLEKKIEALKAGERVDETRSSRAMDAEALAYAAEMREGNAINRARMDTLEEAARDIGAYEEGDLTDGQARNLAKKYNLSGDETQRKEIAVRLREIRAALIGAQSLDKALYDLYTIAKREASAAGHWEDVESGSKEGKAFVKGAKIFVDEQTLSNIAEKYGGRAALRRLTFGKFTLTPKQENGTSGSLDAFYSEALEQHLGLEETTDPDVMVENLLSFWTRSDRIWVEDEGYFGEGQTLEEAATDVAVQMLRDLLYTGRKPTETEKERLARLDVLGEELKKQREQGIHDALTASNEEYQKKLAALQESDLDMLEVERQAERLKAEQRIEALRSAYEARIDAERQNYRDQVARGQLTRDIHRNMSSLGKLIVNGRDADHIPEELRSSILAFAKLFGTNDRNVFTKAMARDLETVYGYIGKEYTEDGEQNPLFAGYDEDIAESIRQLAEIPKAGNGQILTGLLGLEDLRTLATVSEHILAIVKRANSAFIDGRRVRLDGLGDAIIHDAENKERGRLARKMSGRGPYDYLTGDMLTPIWFFKEKVGGTMGEIYEGFRNAQDEWFRKVSRGRDAVQAAKEEFHYKQWKDGTTHFYFTDAFGNVFDHDLSVEQMLQIYATYMRESQNGMESSHLMTGGIVLEEEVQKLGDRIKRLTEKKKGSNEEKTKALSEELERRAINQRFQLSYEQIREIADSLTQEQRDYADAVVKFMSGDVSNWGNDATMRRYGYAKFKEKYYFPFQSSENYLYSKLGTTNDARLKAAGFSKKLVHGAKTPLVISSFSAVAASHIQEMAMYSAFLNPLEDFNQVWSYENKETGKSVKSEIGAVYGSRAQDYVSRFIADVNGGMRSDRIDNIWNKGTSLFKKAAVMANASVVIQQPTALMRAMALINPKYFVGAFRLADYRNMMEHSEVAGIKQMGGFDTGMGASATEWMLDEKSVAEKISDAAGKGAELADAATWTNLWNAVRRETRDKHPDVEVGSEEFYEICRKRFRDIVDYTQVYDSTLSKSALMRSKSALTKMVTAFMAEPTLSFNLITQSGKNRTIHKGRALAAFVANVVVNAAFQSIVGAWRKKDEDETYLEKWIEKFASNLLGDAKVGFLDSSLSPLTMIPWVKDLLSIWEGYDVSRSDVSVFSDLISAVQSVTKEIEKNGRPGFQSVLDLAGVLSAFTPVPIRRATQDVQGLIRQITAWKDGILHNSLEGARDAFLAGIGLEKGKTEGAYQAVLFKDEEYIRRQLIPDKAKIAKYEAEGYSHEDAVKKAEDAAKTAWHTNVRAGLIEQDERVLQAAESKVGYRFDEFEALVAAIVADGFERNDVLKSVEKLVDELRKAGETPEYEEKEEKDEALYAQKDLIPAWDDRDLVNFSKAWDRLEEQGIETKKLVSYSKKFLTEALENGEIGVAERLKTLLIGKGAEEKTVNGYARDYAEIYYDESGMNRPKTLEILMKLAGMEREEAESKLDYWGYKIGNPDGTLTQDQYGKYLEEVKPSGIGVNVYETYVNLRKTATGTDLDGDGKTDSGSVKTVVLQQIDSLPISDEQKDALYRLNGWSEKTINEAPWR